MASNGKPMASNGKQMAGVDHTLELGSTSSSKWADEVDFPVMIERNRESYSRYLEKVKAQDRMIDFTPDDFTYIGRWLARQQSDAAYQRRLERLKREHLPICAIRWLRLIALTEVAVATVNNWFVLHSCETITEGQAKRIMQLMLRCRNPDVDYCSYMWDDTQPTEATRDKQKAAMKTYLTRVYATVLGDKYHDMLWWTLKRSALDD